jgi:hydrogenase maturation factor
MSRPTASAAVVPSCEHDHCVTCGDEAVPMRVLRIDEGRGLALCATGEGEKETVQTELVGPVGPGDDLLVHAGTALTVLQIAKRHAGSLVGTAGPEAPRRSDR